MSEQAHNDDDESSHRRISRGHQCGRSSAHDAVWRALGTFSEKLVPKLQRADAGGGLVRRRQPLQLVQPVLDQHDMCDGRLRRRVSLLDDQEAPAIRRDVVGSAARAARIPCSDRLPHHTRSPCGEHISQRHVHHHHPHHRPRTRCPVEQLSSVARPHRLPTTVGRYQLPSSRSGKRLHVDLGLARLVGLIREIAAIWREFRG